MEVARFKREQKDKYTLGNGLGVVSVIGGEMVQIGKGRRVDLNQVDPGALNKACKEKNRHEIEKKKAILARTKVGVRVVNRELLPVAAD